MERLVRADRMFGTLAFGHARACAGGDQYGLCGHDLAAGQRDFMRAGDLGTLLEDRHLVAFERVGIGALDPLDVLQHIVAQRDPVEGRVLGRPAEIARVLQVLGEMRAVDEHLLGHAAADDAGSADAVFLGHRHLRAMRRRHTAGAHAPRARADGEKVEIILAAGACRQNLSPSVARPHLGPAPARHKGQAGTARRVGPLIRQSLGGDAVPAAAIQRETA